MKLSLIIEAIDRGATRTVGGLGKSLRDLTRSSKEAAGGIGATGRAMVKAEHSAKGLEHAAERVGYAIGSAARHGITALSALDRKIRFTREDIGQLASLSGRLLGTGAAIAGGAILGGITGGLYKIVTTGMEFEKFRTQLTGLMGSVAAGNKAMDWVTDFARKTPYEVDQVMAAFVQLKAYGIDPTDGSLRSLGDTAAGMGKDLMQAVEMIADAQTGEFERLKEFGIKASQKGQQVTFTFMRDGKTMTRVVKKNATEITRTLFDIFNTRFAGGMDRLSQTTEGKWSNVMDRMTITAKQVWEGGLGASVNKQLDRFTGWIDQLANDGSLKKWAEETGQGLGDFVKSIGSMDWKGFAGDLRVVAGALKSVADSMSAVNSVSRFVDDATNWWGLKERIFGGGPGSRGIFVPPAGPPQKRAPHLAPPRVSPFENFLGHLLIPGSRGPAAKSGTAKIALHVTADPGVRVRPAAIAATGLDVQVNTGRAMAGPA